MPPRPPADPTEDRLFQLVDKLVDGFRSELQSFRWELRLFIVLGCLIFAARDGVFADIGIPGITITTHASNGLTTTSTLGGVATAAAAEPATCTEQDDGSPPDVDTDTDAVILRRDP